MSRISVQDLEAIFQQGENEYTEFKCGAINPDAIAKCIAAFANTHGGRIIIGYNDYKNEFVGSSPKDRRGIEKAVSFLEHPPEIDIYNIQHLDHFLLIVDVKKNTNSFTYFKGALYTRTNDRILPMSSSDIQKSFAQNADATYDALFSIIEKLNTKNDELQTQLDAHNTWVVKDSEKSFWWAVIFCVLGSLLGAVLGTIFSKIFL